MTYEQTVAGILEGQAAIPSYLCDMREDVTTVQHNMAPSMTSLQVLTMEGFEKPSTRREFAIHCALDPGILEMHFMTISRLVGANVGVCWCECHAGQDHLEEFGDAHEGDDFRPLMLSPIMEHGNQTDVRVFTDSQDKVEESGRPKKRKCWSFTGTKRWPLLTRPHHGNETDALSI